jgi:hypothetical protein
MKFKSAAAMAMGMAMLGGGLKADDAKAPAWYANTSVKGFVDAYYMYNFNGLQPAAGSRVFDTKSQQFTVNAAKLAITNSDSASGTGGEIDLLYGPEAAIYNGTSANSSLAIEQAFATQAFGPVTFKLGKSGCFFGEEVADVTGDYQYSRGLVYANEPFFTTGLTGTYSLLGGGLTLLGYIGDGASADNNALANKAPDWGLQVADTQIKNLSLTLTYYNQPNGPANFVTSTGPVVISNLYNNIHNFDLLASYTISDTLAVAAEGLYVDTALPSQAVTTIPQQFSTKQDGYAIYVDYKTPVANLTVDPRFEQWFQPDAANEINEYTITVKYAKGPLTHILEFRDDNNANKIYAAGADGTQSPVVSQNTLTYAAVYGF